MNMPKFYERVVVMGATIDVKIVVLQRIKAYSKLAMKHKDDTDTVRICICVIHEDIEILRELDIINSDMYFELLYNRCLNKDFKYLLELEI